MNKLQWVGINVVALLAAGCESVPGPAESADRPFASVEEYRIGVDDRVQVTVLRNPELSVTAPVRPDGKISVPLIGDVEAGGRTPGEVAESIKRLLAVYIREPNVAVIITELRSHEYLSRVRIEKAKNLLLNPNLRISEIAYEVGFQSLTHFNRVFKRILAQSPTEYRGQLARG